MENKNWVPCAKCSGKLMANQRKTRSTIKKNEIFFKKIKNGRDFVVGIHGQERADERKINLNEEVEQRRALGGYIVETQTGKFEGEFKFIVLAKRNNEPLHYVFLKRPEEEKPTLINIYNPTEGMSFKWTADGKHRLFLNTFRSCCPHPEDKQEYHNKKHHGKQHGLYDYQKKTKENE